MLVINQTIINVFIVLIYKSTTEQTVKELITFFKL